MPASTRILRIIAATLLAATAAHAGDKPEPPRIGPMRQREDYSYLANPDRRTGAWWEPLKYVPLGESPLSHAPEHPFLTFGGEARVRYEWLQGSDFGAGTQDSGGYLLTRALPYASLTVPRLLGHGDGDAVSLLLFGQAMIAHNSFDARGPGPVDKEEFDALQAFAQITIPLHTGDANASSLLTLQGGRQMISYGTERLLGTRYGPNIPLSFDGGIARWRNAQWDVSAFYLLPVKVDPEAWQNQSSTQRQVWSLYATRKFGDQREAGSLVADPRSESGSHPPAGSSVTLASADLYYIGYYNGSARFNAGSGREQRHTMGARFFGSRKTQKFGVLDWNYEGMLQAGTFDPTSSSPAGSGAGASSDILAWSIGTETGYTFPLPLSPRIFLRANAISGDLDASDQTLGTFNPLFPKGKYFGELTPVGPYNLLNMQAGVNLNITSTLALTLQGGPYWRYSTQDAVYGVAGNILRASDGSSNSQDIGSQVEIVAEWKPRREVSYLASYSQFMPGDFLKETGPAQVIHYVAFEMQLQF
ncbi:hypothetical protein DB346_00795 [Verrucomicrobia bacterium LW23]|nr:hypothetical protein DB346_00795 [Verrucomicrobia bacterium LW23]